MRTSAASCLCVVILGVVLGLWPLAGSAADSGSPSGEDWEPVNQVLEIPQACAKGDKISCKDEASGEAAAVGDDDGADASNPTTMDGDQKIDIAEPDLQSGQDWGSIDDYENENTIGPVIVIGSGAAASRPIPPLQNPIGAGSTLSTARAPSSPWMLPPSTFSHPAGAPMAMPPSFSTH